MINGFTFFSSYYEALRRLNDEQQAALLRAIVRYVFEGEEPALGETVELLFILMRPTLDKSINRSHKGAAGRKSTAEIKCSNQVEKSNTSLDKEWNGTDRDIYSAQGRAHEKKKPPDKNRFNRFIPQEYDMDDLKNRLISNA